MDVVRSYHGPRREIIARRIRGRSVRAIARSSRRTVAEINRRGTTVLLIEQNAETALSIAHRGIILVKGRVVASGRASELLDNDAVRHLYL